MINISKLFDVMFNDLQIFFFVYSHSRCTFQTVQAHLFTIVQVKGLNINIQSQPKEIQEQNFPTRINRGIFKNKDPNQVFYSQPQVTPKFNTHKKVGSYLSSYSNQSAVTQRFSPKVNFFSCIKTQEAQNKSCKKVKNDTSIQLSLNQFDKKTIKSNHNKEKSTLESSSKDLYNKKTSRKMKWTHKADIIEKLQRKLQDLDNLVNQINLIKNNSQTNKCLQNKDLRYSRKTVKVNQYKKPKQKSRFSLKDFMIIARKGKGRFGQVYLACHIKTGLLVALKSQKKYQLRKNNMIQRFISQVKIQTYLNHPNICKLYGIFDDQDDIYMVIEYMNNGSLYNQMRKFKKFQQKQASLKIYNILSAVSQLHINSIIHRDIKPQNIVVNMGVYKLCDFGWSIVQNDRRQTYCGTFDYVPPQVLKGQKYNFSIDLWELGVLAYQILIGQLPFYNSSRKQTFLKITNFTNTLAFPKNISKQAINFICQLLRRNPEQRRPANEIKFHPFIKKYRQNFQI